MLSFIYMYTYDSHNFICFSFHHSPMPFYYNFYVDFVANVVVLMRTQIYIKRLLNE